MNDLITRPNEGSIAPYSSQPVGLEEVKNYAGLFAASGYFSDSREMAQAATKILYGQEMGIPAVTALQSIYVVKGKMSMSAVLMANLVKRSRKYNYRLETWTDNECAIQFYEIRGNEWDSCGPPSVFTAEDAKRAGTQNMTGYPKAMLFARAMSQGARAYCSDIFGGPIYTPEELGATVNPETGEIVEPPRPALPPLPAQQQQQETKAETTKEKSVSDNERKAQAEAKATEPPKPTKEQIKAVGLEIDNWLAESGFDPKEARLAFINLILGRNIVKADYAICMEVLAQPAALWNAAANKLRAEKADALDEDAEGHGTPDEAEEGPGAVNPT